jgi:DME family drug/metabolite transporter
MRAMKTAPWSVVAAALLFASAGVASSYAPPGAPAALWGEARLLLGGALLGLWLGPPALLGAWASLPRAPLAAAALSMAIFQWSFFAAVQAAGVAVATLASAATPVYFVEAIELTRSRRAPRAGFVLAAALCALGLAILDRLSGAGVSFALVSALAYAAYASATARLERSRMGGGGLASTAMALLLAGLLLLPAAGGGIAVLVTPAGLLVAAWLGAVATALAYALFVRGLGRMRPSGALAVLSIQAFAAIVAGATLLGEQVDASLLAAGGAFALALVVQSFPFSSSTLKMKGTRRA